MSIIKLLPDSVANQIAAGEVVQRPSSVVKELLENSVDSGAKTIRLIIKDAGKTLIHVLDDGIGMNKDDLKLKKRENDYLQQIFYKGSSKKGSY